jgi:hypothetical protein
MRSEELYFSKAWGWPYESNAKESTQSRSVKAMSYPVLGTEKPSVDK